MLSVASQRLGLSAVNAGRRVSSIALTSSLSRTGLRGLATPAGVRPASFINSGLESVSILKPQLLNHVSRMNFSTEAPAAPSSGFKHLRYEVIEEVGVIRMDAKDNKVNTLSKEFSTEFEQLFKQVQNDPRVKAIVVISSKPDNFIAGADIQMLASAKTTDEVRELSVGGQRMFNEIENSKKPVIAAINGSCLGGGLEAALACHYRIASESPKTALALPEVQLGLLPGAGGTQRLPRLVGLQAALDMILTGKNIKPSKAIRMGLVDQVADPNALEPAAIQAALNLAKGEKPKRKEKGLVNKLLEDTPVGRKIVLDKAKQMVEKQTKGHYPAPLAILKVIETGLNEGFEKGLQKEAEEFSKLAHTPESKALVSIFFAQTALKKNRYGKPANDIKKIAMLGAGLMGAGITQVSAQKAGYQVVLYDRDQKGIARGEKQVYTNLNSAVKKKNMTSFERDSIMSRILGFTDNTPGLENNFKNVDLIIEAVPEDLALKHRVLSRFEALVPDHCVIASNTSALPISQIAAGLKRPERVIGMHYFSPVEKMPLLEIITTDKTSKEASAVAVEAGLRQGKVVIVVKDGPGFYTTRILSPMMVEAMRLLQHGVDIQELDKSLRDFGFPVGPVTLMDEVGIDVGKHVSSELIEAFGERMGGADTALMEKFLAKGWLGRKSGKGFFVYTEEKKPKGLLQKILSPLTKAPKKPLNEEAVALLKSSVTSPKTFDKTELQHRMVFRFVNEAVLCLQEGILETPAEGDIGAIFGLGFPPFLGGPFRYLDRIGAKKAVEIMEQLHRSSGGEKCFEPAELLKKHARDGTTFHKQ